MAHSIAYYTRDTITDEVIMARIDHLNRLLAEELPDDPPLFPEDGVKRARNLPSIAHMHVWCLSHDGVIEAEASLGWAELDSNRQSASIHVSVEPGLRRCGVGSHLLSLAVDHARRVGRTRLFAGSSDRVPAGQAFLEYLSFDKGLEAHTNQLALACFDKDLLARWLAMGPERAADYEVELWDGPVPEGRLVAFAELSNVMNGEPHGTLEVEDTIVTPQMIRDGEAFMFANGSRRLVACARHVPSGNLAGFTELAWNPKRASIVWQYGTGVVVAHRNKGLGRWLKAANMEAMLRANLSARFVRTGNADSNVPMLAINRQMGFKPFSAQATWQGQADAIAARLASVGFAVAA
jgi:GNAT superfamily N-acetyltransferase